MVPIRNFRGWLAAVIFLVVFLSIKIFGCKSDVPYQHNEGIVFTTDYHFTYQSKTDYQDSIEALLQRFDNSVSPFNTKSLISSVNNNDTSIVADIWLKNLIKRSKEIWVKSRGAFDPTVSPLVNAWGFGYKEGKLPNDLALDSIMQYVGMDKIYLRSDGKIVKTVPGVTLNFSAIAKGYAADIVADFLQNRRVDNFLVEIGGEIVSRGVNPEGKVWHIGIDKPDVSNLGGELQSIISVNNTAMATSGNYRNFKVINGKRVGHTMDPRTGKPAENSLLSATVIAKDCMTADAYATAFMAMGIEDSKLLLNSEPSLQVLFIYSVDTTRNEVYMTEGMSKLVKSVSNQ